MFSNTSHKSHNHIRKSDQLKDASDFGKTFYQRIPHTFTCTKIVMFFDIRHKSVYARISGISAIVWLIRMSAIQFNMKKMCRDWTKTYKYVNPRITSSFGTEINFVNNELFEQKGEFIQRHYFAPRKLNLRWIITVNCLYHWKRPNRTFLIETYALDYNGGCLSFSVCKNRTH